MKNQKLPRQQAYDQLEEIQDQMVKLLNEARGILKFHFAEESEAAEKTWIPRIEKALTPHFKEDSSFQEAIENITIDVQEEAIDTEEAGR